MRSVGKSDSWAGFFPHRKSQVWYGDFIIALTIFVAAVMIYWSYQNNYVPETKSIQSLSLEAVNFGMMLNSEGIPVHWTSVNVTRVGISNANNRINESKLREFAMMNPETVRRISNLEYKYFVYFHHTNGSFLPINATLDAVGVNPQNATRLVETKRLMIRDNEFVNMIIQVWE